MRKKLRLDSFEIAEAIHSAFISTGVIPEGHQISVRLAVIEGDEFVADVSWNDPDAPPAGEGQ